MSQFPILLLSLLVSLHLSSCSTTNVSDYYVKPSSESECDFNPCMTLDEYANCTKSLDPNARFWFLSGSHNLTTDFTLSKQGGAIQMSTMQSNEHITIHLLCCDIIFDSITNLILKNLTIIGASANNMVIRTTQIEFQIDTVHLLECSLHFILLSTTDITALSPNVVTNTICKSNLTNSRGSGLKVIDKRTQGILVLEVSSTTISHHQEGGVIIESSTILTLTISNCIIEKNQNQESNNGIGYSAGLSIYTTQSNASKIYILNSWFIGNQDWTSQHTVVFISGVYQVIVTECEFRNNVGTGIRATNILEALHLAGKYVNFVNNTALQGGALALASTQVHFMSGIHVLFENNYAYDVGGAIFVESTSSVHEAVSDPNTLVECFYKLDPTIANLRIQFKHNKAENGGHDIYGVSLNSYCVVYVLSGAPKRSFEVFTFFELDNLTSSVISSNPYRVCVLDSQFPSNQTLTASCVAESQIFMNKPIFPGEEIQFEVIITGAEFGTTKGLVHAQFLEPSTKSKLQSHQYYQKVDKLNESQTLNYLISSNRTYEMLVLTANDGPVASYGNEVQISEAIESYNSTSIIPSNLLTTPVFINVTFENCPLGFYRKESSTGSRCTCNPQLCRTGDIKADFSNGTGTFYLGNNTWVKAFKEGESDIIILHNNCPFDYCRKKQIVGVDIENDPDAQCNLNHAGRLCGECIANLSLAIGSNKCLNCPNSHKLALLIFFAIAGFMLILFIKALNMTVSQGTISGLLFYANVIWTYQSILFDNHSEGNSFSKFFIAWINLDFGIEICFIQGLTAYEKTWLQFVFPLYIWSIAGAIVLAARCSKRMTNLFGNNSVQVLATLFLLSYAKLLRTVITILVPATLYVYTENGTALPLETKIVWAFGGNLEYGRVPHIFLLILALLVLIILCLPYTFVLLFIRPLRGHSDFKFLNWINTLKPLLDAYVGPLKPVNHFWVGLLLLARFILFLTFTLTYTSSPLSSMLALNVTVVLLLTVLSHSGQLYNATMKLDWHYFPKEISFRSILEVSFLFNLAVVGGGILYANGNIKTKRTVIYTSVSVAFLEFIGIVTYHFWCNVKPCILKFAPNPRRGYQNLDREHDNANTSTTSTIGIGANGTSGHRFDSNNYKSSQVREPLLTESPI